MIHDKKVRVTYSHTDQKSEQITITITAQQIESTVRRRINTLIPGARIIDLADVSADVEQKEAPLGRRK